MLHEIRTTLFSSLFSILDRRGNRIPKAKAGSTLVMFEATQRFCASLHKWPTLTRNRACNAPLAWELGTGLTASSRVRSGQTTPQDVELPFTMMQMMSPSFLLPIRLNKRTELRVCYFVKGNETLMGL